MRAWSESMGTLPMKPVISSKTTLPLVLLGCLTVPVPGPSSECEKPVYKPLRTLANPTRSPGRRRRELPVRSVERGIDRARMLSEAARYAEAIDAYRTLLRATEGDERFGASRARVAAALAALESRLDAHAENPAASRS
jgi:hypothetical protein